MVTIFSDGGSRGNPGPAACAFVIYAHNKEDLKASKGRQIHSDSKYLGVTTNNVAEYSGVLLALDGLKKFIHEPYFDYVEFKMDSELVVKQINGVYKVKDGNLMNYVLRIKDFIKANNLKISFIHIPRKENAFADKLVNEKLDESSRR